MMGEEKKIHEKYYLKVNGSNSLRYKWYKEKYFRNTRNKKILEIGCGDGGVVQYLKGENEVYAADISKNAVKFLREKGIKAFLVDVSKEKLPFGDSSFDAVIALEVFEHLKSPQSAAEEIQRVLRKNGRLIISTPNPRSGHKLIYPALFRFNNFREYLRNNRFFVISSTSYGVCPPFWKQLSPFIARENKKEKQKASGEGGGVTFLSKVARFMSSDLMNFFKPKMFGLSFVFECTNVDPLGAKSLYREIAEETKGAYE